LCWLEIANSNGIVIQSLQQEETLGAGSAGLVDEELLVAQLWLKSEDGGNGTSVKFPHPCCDGPSVEKKHPPPPWVSVVGASCCGTGDKTGPASSQNNRPGSICARSRICWDE